MRIMHVLLSRGFAGSERSTAESCNQQCKEHSVCLVIRKGQRKNGVSILDHLDPKVELIEVPARILTKWALSKAVAQFKPEVIHCHLRRATRLVTKLTSNAATCSTLHIQVNSQHFLKMDGLICNARWQVVQVAEIFSGKVHKANNSLVPHRRISSEERAQLRQQLGLDDKDILIAGVGRYHPSKAWDTLIKAFSAIDVPSNVHLLFFGAGSQEAELKNLALQNKSVSKNIRFIGYREDIKDLYQCFDMLVCPSRFEPLPRVILECMDAGTPVIASDSGGCEELIDDYGGQKFETDNVEQLSNLLAKNIANPPERHRPDLSAHFLDNSAKALVDFYRTL